MTPAQSADVAYDEERYADCAHLYAQASELASGRARASFLYGAGSCELRTGQRVKAIDAFRKAASSHISYCDDIVNDARIQRDLAGDPQWTAAMVAIKPSCESYTASIQAELREIYRADQDDRKAGAHDYDKIDWSVVTPRDEARRERVKQLEAAGQLRSADDFYHAAMIMQHGDNEASYGEAFRLSSHAVSLVRRSSKRAGSPPRRKIATTCRAAKRNSTARKSSA